MSIEEKLKFIAGECRAKGLNFCFVVEDKGIHDIYYLNGETKIRKVVDCVKDIER